MTLNVNGTAMENVYINGVRMEIVNINGTEVYRGEKGNVTSVFKGGGSGTFLPGAEDVNRHFVLIGARFSGGGLPLPSNPTLGGVTMNLITRGASGNYDDGGVTGIYTLKVPTGTASIAFSAASFQQVMILRVTGCAAMLTTNATSYGTSNGALSGTRVSPANGKGCVFLATVANFATPATPTPNSTGLTYVSGNAMAASNSVTANTQTISCSGNQISSFAIFPYTYF